MTSLKFTLLSYSSYKFKAQCRAVLQCPLWILDRPVMLHRENCGYVRITGCVKMNIVTNFLEQLNNPSPWVFLTPPSTARAPREAAGVQQAFQQYLAVSQWGSWFHGPRDRGLISRLLDTFLHSVRTGCWVHAAN
jgi:hypothetical protein